VTEQGRADRAGEVPAAHRPVRAGADMGAVGGRRAVSGIPRAAGQVAPAGQRRAALPRRQTAFGHRVGDRDAQRARDVIAEDPGELGRRFPDRRNGS
jgi:hypothetical protein